MKRNVNVTQTTGELGGIVSIIARRYRRSIRCRDSRFARGSPVQVTAKARLSSERSRRAAARAIDSGGQPSPFSRALEKCERVCARATATLRSESHWAWRRPYQISPFSKTRGNNTHSSSSSSSSRRLILSASGQRRASCDVCGYATGVILSWFTLRQQGCSPPDDLPQDYSRGNAPRLHWRVSPAPLPLSLSCSGLCSRSRSFRFALSLYHHLARSLSYYLAIFLPFLPPPSRPVLLWFSCPVVLFPLPATVLFHACRVYLSPSFSFPLALLFLFFSTGKLFFLSSHDFLPFLTHFARSVLLSCISVSLSPMQSVFLLDSRYPSRTRRSKAPSRWWHTHPSLCMRTPRTVPFFRFPTLSCSAHAVKISLWPISRRSTGQRLNKSVNKFDSW